MNEDNKHRINNIMAYSDYKSSCDILSISSYNSNSSSEGTDNQDESSEFCIEDFLNPEYFKNSEAAKNTDTANPAATNTHPVFYPNDPLRYFLVLGEITQSEYVKWKLVNEEPRSPQPPKKHRIVRPDYGPGHNSDSDSVSDEDINGLTTTTTTFFGTGYSVLTDEYTDPFDPWNLTPDTTSDRRYTKIATDGTFMLKRLTQSVQYDHSATGPGNKFNFKLSESFELKLLWERFLALASPYPLSQRFHTLQDFWQGNALKIYEALQDLRADQARVRGNRHHSVSADIPLPPQYHSTPFETLENTFETIGRMSRCIAEDFNTQSVVNYVEEFLVALYREIEFNALVEAYEESISVNNA